MAKWLKQSTAVDVKIGPFIDDTDGKTAETALTTAYTSVYVFKNGSTSVNKNETTAIAHDVIGFYLVKLNATDTNTLGILKIATHVAGHLSVWDDFMVVPANVYDSLVGGSDALDVSMIQILGTAVATPATAGILDVNVKNIDNDAASASGTVTFPNATLASTTGAVGSVTGAVGSVTGNVGGNVAGSVGSVVGHTAQTGDSYARLGAPVGASVSADIAAVKADTGTINTNTTAAAQRAAVGLASANLDTQLTAIDDLLDTEVAAIKAKTDYLPSATAGAAGGLFIAGANAATSVDTAFTANIAGSMSGNVEGNVNGSVGSVVGNVGGNVTGSVGSVVGFTPSNIADIISTLGNPSEPTMSGDIAAARAALADIKGATFDTATDSLEAIRNRGDAAWATATGFSTLDAAGVRAALGMATNDLDAQIAALPTAAENADANWDEARAGHVAAGSFGENVVADVTKVGGNAASISPTPGLLNARLTEISVSGAVALGVIQNGNVVAGVTNPVAVNSLANNVVTSAALDATAVNEIADGLLDRTNGIDIGLTPRHALELAAASVLQKLTGAGTGTERVRNFADTADLATVTVDGAGNKSAIIYDFSI